MRAMARSDFCMLMSGLGYHAAYVATLACSMAVHPRCGPADGRQMCHKHGATLQACFVDFGMAAQNGGRCILRFDDTNPDAEKQEFIDHIQDIISWLGWTPAQVQT